MSIALIVLLVIGAVVVLWLVSTYNSLVSQKQMVEEAFSGIDVQLKRRSDLVPQLVESVKGYAGHEQATLEMVTELRTQSQMLEKGDIEARQKVENELSEMLSKLLVVVEDYPDLKAADTFRELMDSLVEIEDDIQMARRYYNGSVRDMNILVQSFPNNLTASPFGFKKAVFFELESLAERLPPEVHFETA